MSVQHLAGYGLIALFVMLSAVAVAWYRDIRRTRQGDAEVWQVLGDKKLPGYDGVNYELPEWNDDYWPPQAGDTAEFPAVPDSTVSGAFHVIEPTDDTDEAIAAMNADAADYIAKMRAETDAVLARLRAPLDVQ